ncbi:sulfotransferase [Candidatus Roseilinea sp. NK_OTU-006]|jgi:hypothetical protein|uniref:sulfotransferase n=1 Tax=Candidatus Roseilinea sp. NK_OTU-006 TaxID=2704250 RepID=UPI00145FA0D0|nr:sulfotransferase [Candidatus Roseilinea sp. NK_OTU-006]
MTGTLTVLYITGAGRSGGTLLGRLLDQVANLFYVGELRQLWRPGLTQRLCACGQAIGRCDFWQAVFRCAWGCLDYLDPVWMDVMRMRYTRTRHAWRPLPSPGRDADLDRFVAVLGRLYHAVADQSGSRVVVDTSRTTAYAALLARMPDVRVCPLHLVRDPRAVVFSWQRQRSGMPAPAAARLQRKQGLQAALEWSVQNVLAERWRARVGGMLLRYEDLIAAPREALGRVLGLVGVQDALSFLNDGVALLRPGHSVEGNIYRLAAGEVVLRLDDAWRTELPAWMRRQTALMCWPGMLRYGYSL